MRAARFLVVDDNPSWIQLVRAMLLAWGVTTVFGAESVSSAQALLERQTVEMILCDLNMPDEDGLALLRWVRCQEIPRIRSLPFIIMTSETTRTNIMRAGCCGADLVVEKPLKPVTLWPRAVAMLSRAEPDVRSDPPCSRILETPCPLIPAGLGR